LLAWLKKITLLLTGRKSKKPVAKLSRKRKLTVEPERPRKKKKRRMMKLKMTIWLIRMMTANTEKRSPWAGFRTQCYEVT